MEVDKISGHRSVRSRGGAIAVLYETHWEGLLWPSWEREADFLHARQRILEYWARAPLQVDRRTGCTAICAWVPLNASSPATRVTVSCLSDTTTVRKSPNVGPSIPGHYPARRRPLLVQRSRSSWVTRKHFGAHPNSWTVYSSRCRRPRTGQARSLFCSVYYGSRSCSRFVVSTGASRKFPHAWYCTQRR